MMHDYVYTDTYTLYICVVDTYMYRSSPQFQFVLFEIMLNWYKWKLIIVLIFIHRSFDIGFHFASYLSAALWDTLWYCASHCVRVKLPSLTPQHHHNNNNNNIIHLWRRKKSLSQGYLFLLWLIKPWNS